MSARTDRPRDPRTEATCCLPCIYGVHDACRHHPQGRQFSRPQSEAGKPCACEKSGHHLGDGFCDGHVHGDWGGRGCDRPAKFTVEVRAGDGVSFIASSSTKGTDAPVTIELCGIHHNGLQKRRANEARWRAESAARDERYAEDRRARKAADEWAERLRSEFGVPATAHDTVVAVSPEHLYRLIVDTNAIAADVVDVSELPFRPRPEEAS